ncbi:uncharacterized protein LOC124356194 [Homalodisca vitripennis]|uniref:uncharacterized protein LOC124356194 n=1 Tax=Homalodisca vitripennis TaxID=197043 RepID=UPI001EECA87A|nr:uncharacterized protein LOC124356194 [Homalodisca vitripennis]
MNTSTLLILALGCVVAADQSEFSQEEYKRVIGECKREAGFSEKDLDMTEIGKVGMERFDPRDQYKRMISCAMKALKLMDESGEMDTKRSSEVVDSLMKGRAPEEALQAKTVLMECAEKQKRKSFRGYEVAGCIADYMMKAKDNWTSFSF